MSKFIQTLYYSALFAAPILLAISYKNVANVIPLLFLLVLILSWKEWNITEESPPIYIFFLVFLAFTFITSLWSYQQAAALERIIKILLLFIPACILIASGHPKRYLHPKHTWWCLVISFFFTVALTGWQLYENRLLKNILMGAAGEEHVSAYLNPAIICLVVLVWPLLALTQCIKINGRTKITATLLFAMAIITVVCYGESDTARVAGIISISCFVLVRLGVCPSIFKPFIVASIIIVCIAPPILYDRAPVKDYKISSENVLVQKLARPSYLHRIEIWDRCLELVVERPIFGWGMAASFNLPELNEPSKYLHGQKRTNFMYPHNIFIQCLLEYGVIGLTLFLLWLNALINWISKTPISVRAYYSAAFITIITVYSFGFPMWRSWWIVFLLVIPIIFMALNKQSESRLTFSN